MRILVIQIATILLTIGLCSSNTSEKAISISVEADGIREAGYVHTASSYLDNVDDVAPRKNDSKKEDQSEDKLPILPPIILLDFGNDTEEENVTSEEKSKRTVNSGLGYGLDTNALRSRKYNYYFPAGKSGTTVSIEESISPFLPKTIIERVQPDNEGRQFGARENSFVSSLTDLNGQTKNQADLRYLNLQESKKSQSVFGLRTKPHKTGASPSFESYKNLSNKPPIGSFVIPNSGYENNGVPTTTQSPLAFSGTEAFRYVTSNPMNFVNSESGTFNYATVAPFSGIANTHTYTDQRQNIQSNINSHGFVSSPQSVESPTASPLNYNLRFPNAGSQFSNSPRYTSENGVRYENKVFWKYPDGRVSDVPPPTYVETYSKYPQSLAQQPVKSQNLHSIYESSTTENSILSQGPVQFPTVSEQTGQEPNPFVSAESLSSSLPQQQVYRLGYQNLVTQKQNVNLAQQRKPSSNVATSYSFSSSFPSSSSSSSFSSSSSGRTRNEPNDSKINHDSRYRQTLSKYMVNSPNPEYTNSYTTESIDSVNNTTPLNEFLGSSAEHSTRATSKYNPKIHNYLDTLLSEDEGSKKQSFGTNDISSYSNLRYSDLLNYNPSISEYIRNPSSILNVRPTFVQAGNSLVPVIILRVDGASPIQTKATQNINLKALLQQYLIQYAKNIQELAQPSTYNLGTESFSKGSTPGSNKSPVLDLIRLTQDDAREAPSYHSNSYVGRPSYETSDLERSKDFLNNRYNVLSSGRQKMKNVEILEDPRFMTHGFRN